MLIFLTTPTEEAALLEVAREYGLAVEKDTDPEFGVYRRLEKVGQETVIAISPSRRGGQIVMGAHGRRGTAWKGIMYREATLAQAIVQLGMAFGLDPGVQKPGDVLISTSLIPYDHRRIRPAPDGDLDYAIDYPGVRREPARPSLLAMFRREPERGSFPFGVSFGAMLSGGARIHCARYRDELVRGIPATEGEPIVGGEMEGVGLLAASIAEQDPIWCVVKGISDFADEGRDAVIESTREIACRNAARFVISALLNDDGQLPRGSGNGVETW